jgi:hypothetical protein
VAGALIGAFLQAPRNRTFPRTDPLMHRLTATVLAAFALASCDILAPDDEPFTLEGEWELSLVLPMRQNPSDPPNDCVAQSPRLHLTVEGDVVRGTTNGISFFCSAVHGPGMGASTIHGSIVGDRVSLVIQPDSPSGWIVQISLMNGIVVPPSETPGGAVFELRPEVIYWSGAGENRRQLRGTPSDDYPAWLDRAGRR